MRAEHFDRPLKNFLNVDLPRLSLKCAEDFIYKILFPSVLGSQSFFEQSSIRSTLLTEPLLTKSQRRLGLGETSY